MNENNQQQLDDTGHNNVVADEAVFPTGKLFCALGFMLAALAMLSLPLSRVFLPFDMLTHFSLHFMIAGGAFLSGFFMPKWHFRTAILLIVLGMGGVGWMARNAKPEPEKAAGAGYQNLRIMTFNTWLSNHKWRDVANEIRARNPDVVALLEFGREKAPLLKALKAQYPYQLDCQKKTYCHMAVLSRYKFNHTKIQTRWPGPPFVRVQLGEKFGKVNIFAVHTIRPPHYRAHYRQINALAGEVNKIKGRKIVMGDFNSTPFSRTLRQFGKRTRLTRITGTPSWPSHLFGLPQLAIDHIFVSKDIKVAKRHFIGNNAGSDHFPVIAVVSIPQQTK